MSANTYSLDIESGSSQRASISDASQTGLDITGDITIELWMKPETVSFSIPVGKFTGGASSRSYAVLLSGATSFQFAVRGILVSLSSTTSVVVGEWIHVAITRSSATGTILLYINGLLEDTEVNATGTLNNTTTEFAIGRSGGFNYDGLIDEVRIWNDIRTASEIADNYDKELIGTESNLQGYWKLNNNYTDETSNGNDLTAVNSPVFSTDVPFTGSTEYTQALTVTAEANPDNGFESSFLKSLTATAQATASFIREVLKGLTTTAQATIVFTKQALKNITVTAEAIPSMISGLLYTEGLIATAQAQSTLSLRQVALQELVATAQATASLERLFLYERILTVTAQITTIKIRNIGKTILATARSLPNIKKAIAIIITSTGNALTQIQKINSLSQLITVTAQAVSTLGTQLSKTMTATAQAVTEIIKQKALSKLLTATGKLTGQVINTGLILSRTLLVTAKATVTRTIVQSLKYILTKTAKAVTRLLKDYGYVDKYPQNDTSYEDKYPE